jgi:hypothetical protein
MPPKSSPGDKTKKNSVPKDKEQIIARQFKNAIKKKKYEEQHSDDDSLGTAAPGQNSSQSSGSNVPSYSQQVHALNPTATGNPKNDQNNKMENAKNYQENKMELAEDHQNNKMENAENYQENKWDLAEQHQNEKFGDANTPEDVNSENTEPVKKSISDRMKSKGSLPTTHRKQSASQTANNPTSPQQEQPGQGKDQAPGLDAGPEKSGGQVQKPDGDKKPGEKKPEEAKKKPYEAGGGPGGEINPGGNKKPGGKKNAFKAGGGRVKSAAKDTIAATKKAGADAKRKLNAAKQKAKDVKNAVTAPARKAKAAAAAVKNKLTAPIRKIQGAKAAMQKMVDDLNPFKKLKEIGKEIWRLIPVAIRMLLSAKGLGPFLQFLDKLLKKNNVDKCLTCGCCTCVVIQLLNCLLPVLIFLFFIGKIAQALS